MNISADGLPGMSLNDITQKVKNLHNMDDSEHPKVKELKMKLPNDEGQLNNMMNHLNEFTNTVLPSQLGQKQAALDMQKENEEIKRRQLQAIEEVEENFDEQRFDAKMPKT